MGKNVSYVPHLIWYAYFLVGRDTSFQCIEDRRYCLLGIIDHRCIHTDGIPVRYDDRAIRHARRLKLVTQDVECQVVGIEKVLDAMTLDESTPERSDLKTNGVAEITLQTRAPLVYDNHERVPSLGRASFHDGPHVGALAGDQNDDVLHGARSVPSAPGSASAPSGVPGGSGLAWGCPAQQARPTIRAL